MQASNNRTATGKTKPETSSVATMLTRIIALMEEIVQVMDEEIPLVEGRKRTEHAELLKRKQRLTLDYRASLKAIVLEPDLLRQAPEELRATARAAAAKLAEASERNATIVRAIIAASQRLVQSIITIVKDEKLPTNNYAKLGTGAMAGVYSPICKPVTVYQSA